MGDPSEEVLACVNGRHRQSYLAKRRRESILLDRLSRQEKVVARNADAVRLRAEGLTFREIGERLGVSSSAVRYIVKAATTAPGGA